MLIDFANPKDPKDIRVDFVLFENSIRFWYFPDSTSFEERVCVNRYLFEKDGYKKIASDILQLSTTKTENI